jgi:alkanesulfonate monooxygenase SsuD/methylene tetrahydromethanopterin reductase-like flavin-dependent oxidoreductase (luciferase family)
MGVFYWQMLERNGFEAEVGASKAAWTERDREKSILAISDDMVRECQVIGSAEEVRAQLQERFELGADIQMLYMPQGTPDEFRTWLSNLTA